MTFLNASALVSIAMMAAAVLAACHMFQPIIVL